MESTDTEEEYYRFTWPGKRQAAQQASHPAAAALRPDKANSRNWDSTANIFIEGDNLEALRLLQDSHLNKIRLIYIDPPYNTGNEFVYKDNYADNLRSYLALTGQTDAAANKEGSLPETGGRYHSNWLNMMYPRLLLARNLLAEDGAIFISIDDKEVHNLRKLCDEVFGEENFIASVIWKHTQQSKNDEPYFSRHYNYQVVYRKSAALKGFSLPRTEQDNKNYANPDNDPRGPWRSGDVRSPNYRKTLCFDIATPGGKIIPPPANGWRWSKKNVEEKISTGEIFFSPDESRIIRKIYLSGQTGRTPENIWTAEDAGSTREANAEIKALFDNIVVFDTPKPTRLIEKILQLFHPEKDLTVLDFFAGSGTTAQAVLQLNAKDGGRRTFICVQIPEPTAPHSPACKAGFSHIAAITRARIQRAAQQIEAQQPGSQQLEARQPEAATPTPGFQQPEAATPSPAAKGFHESPDGKTPRPEDPQAPDTGFRAFTLEPLPLVFPIPFAHHGIDG